MPTASLSSLGDGLTIRPLSQTVINNASPFFHNLCGVAQFTECDTPGMDSDKNGGPNHLRAWREFRSLTQSELAEKVDTNANMIGYLESGERGLSAKWLRRLAPALRTTPGMLLDHDPNDLPSDIHDIWVKGTERERRQITEIARTLVKTGTAD
jgi:transcriptional regulator with XRE-family HTH domain